MPLRRCCWRFPASRCIAITPGFAAIYRVFGLLTAFIPMLILGHWGRASHLDLAPKLIESGYHSNGIDHGRAVVDDLLGGTRERLRPTRCPLHLPDTCIG